MIQVMSPHYSESRSTKMSRFGSARRAGGAQRLSGGENVRFDQWIGVPNAASNGFP